MKGDAHRWSGCAGACSMPAVLRSLFLVAAAALLVLAAGHLTHHYLMAGDAYPRFLFF